MFEALSILLYGLVQSAVLLLIALGFSVTFGISGIPNFAHGGIYILSGFACWYLLRKAHWPYPLAVAATVALAAAIGTLLYWLVIRPVRRLVLAEVLATFAVGVAFLELFRWMGLVTYEFHLPPVLSGSVTIGGVTMDRHRLVIVGAAAGLGMLLWWFGRATRTGLALRAMAQEEYTALAMGVHEDRMAAIGVALGSALAAVAAVLVLPLGIISINLGYDAILVALALTVTGGTERTAGLLLAALLLGMGTVLASMVLGPHWSEVIYLLAIVVVLAVRPSGILGRFKELEERV
ncbi:MAG: branched-chain amino acid ABC transporter permease [Armatimonadota bacterium]|nr:branched-chain amino acid ABC transporter permease [Armatimonadota bacterium]MDR7439961.1 branched-chain amino acid ABC transporter permease [Armatimonadota bacterium]MDR7562374.1 branched-chain amino acid ABC transporter permease [Armatimonadota bacterium]MDR7567245.1 branched-chain amino acid ABC transporter permease [Armatimonadota bacterium]MDR7601544.1 branched-chain amino acid ABC transporter permease [Armatimonadota bacterium]